MTSTDQTTPSGGAWAAILSAAIGCLTFGILAFLTEFPRTAKPMKKILDFYDPSGDLSGKSTVAVVVWLVAWFLLHARWKARDIRRPGLLTWLSFLLILLAMALMFPPLIEAITGADQGDPRDSHSANWN